MALTKTIRDRVVQTAVVLFLGSIVAALSSLRAEGVRDRILARVSAILAEEYGLALTVEDFIPSWRSSRVNLRGVRVGAPGASSGCRGEGGDRHRAFLAAPPASRAAGAGDREGVRADLNAPIPKIPESPEEAGAGPPVEIRRGAMLFARLLRVADTYSIYSRRYDPTQARGLLFEVG